MATLRENAEIVRSTARQFRAIIEMAEQMEDIDKVAAAIDEQKQALVKAQEATAFERSITANVMVANSKLKLNVEHILRDAKMEAANIMADAEIDIEKQRKQIKAEGAQFSVNLRAAKDKLSALHKSASDMDVQIEDKQAKIAELEAELKALYARMGG